MGKYSSTAELAPLTRLRQRGMDAKENILKIT